MDARAASSKKYRVGVVVLLTAALITIVPQVLAQSSTPQPTFIVSVHTEIPGQGAPTLDVVDLERYFAEQLTYRHIQSTPAASAKIPNPAPPNLYLIEVTVDAMRPAQRSEWVSNDGAPGY